MNNPVARTSITLAAGIFLISAATGQVPMAPALAPPRAPAARKQPLAAPAQKRASAPATSVGGPTQEDLKQFDQMLRSLTTKERKNFTKAFRQLTPEGRKQLIENMTHQRSGKPSQVGAPRVLKAPPPLPPRLVF